MDFRKKLEKLMKQKKVTTAKLARAADLTYPTVFNFLRGKSQMRSGNLEKLFAILNKMKGK